MNSNWFKLVMKMTIQKNSKNIVRSIIILFSQVDIQLTKFPLL